MVKEYNWDLVPTEQLTDKMERKIIHGDKIMVAKMKFKDGFIVPLHSHENEQLSTIVKGTMRIWFGENKEIQKDMGPGDVVVIPEYVPHEALMIGDVEAIDTWAPPRQDWLDGSDNYLRNDS